MPANNKLLAEGKIAWLGVNEGPTGFSTAREQVMVTLDGIEGDHYCGNTRLTSGHDGAHMRVTGLQEGVEVKNLRPVTGLGTQDVLDAQEKLSRKYVAGMMRENVLFHLAPGLQKQSFFSKLKPGSRIVVGETRTVMLWVTEENTPCSGVASPFAEHYGDPALEAEFGAAFRNRRGQMLLPWSGGLMKINDPFWIYGQLRS